MKALTIRQPHVEAILRGLKTFETRSWRTNVRGRILVHAGAASDRQRIKLLIETNHPHSDLTRQLPLGAIVGAVDIVDCIRTEDVPPAEQEWGDFTPGRWAWKLGNVRRFPVPAPCKGALSFWEPAKLLSTAALDIITEWAVP